MRAWLQREIGPKIIRYHPLGGHDFLGSGEGSAAPVEGGGVARRHCTIIREGKVFRLRDVHGARRGTLVNYRYVKDAVLVPGDQVQVGATVLRFYQLEPGRPRPAPDGAKIVALDAWRP